MPPLATADSQCIFSILGNVFNSSIASEHCTSAGTIPTGRFLHRLKGLTILLLSQPGMPSNFKIGWQEFRAVKNIRPERERLECEARSVSLPCLFHHITSCSLGANLACRSKGMDKRLCWETPSLSPWTAKNKAFSSEWVLGTFFFIRNFYGTMLQA